VPLHHQRGHQLGTTEDTTIEKERERARDGPGTQVVVMLDGTIKNTDLACLCLWVHVVSVCVCVPTCALLPLNGA